MDLWYPPDEEAPLLEWWTPLVLAAAAARRERVPWAIHVDEFGLQGRVDRTGRPPIWVYHHHASGQELYLDPEGNAYRFTRTPNGRSYGRFTSVDIRRAILQAGLPRHVEPVWYDEPRPPAARFAEDRLPLDGLVGERAEGAPPDHRDGSTTARRRHAAAHEPGAAPEPTRARRRPRPDVPRGHLTLIQGGRQAG
jgi:hypothetical protein